MRKLKRRLLLSLTAVVLPLVVWGHKLESGQAVLTLSPDQIWILEMELNLTRYIQSNPNLAKTTRPQFRELEKSGEMNDENFDDWEALFLACEEQFRTELQVVESTTEVEHFEMWFQHPSELPDEAYQTMLVDGLHVKAFASGRLETESSTLQFRFPLDVGEVILTTVQPRSEWVVTGELSSPVSLSSGALLEEGGRSQSIFRYVWVGFRHIIPEGLDHVLFVFGLFLLAARARPLLLQVTAFTLAHTLTLGLSIYGVFSLPSDLVEPLIALSIAGVAIENVLTDKVHPWRPVIVFLFGLLHGLGFAGALGEIGLPVDEFLFALVSFNVGVEIGQVLVIAVAFLALGIFRNKSWYRARLTIPISCLIGIVGLYWTVERFFF